MSEGMENERIEPTIKILARMEHPTNGEQDARCPNSWYYPNNPLRSSQEGGWVCLNRKVVENIDPKEQKYEFCDNSDHLNCPAYITSKKR